MNYEPTLRLAQGERGKPTSRFFDRLMANGANQPLDSSTSSELRANGNKSVININKPI